MSETPKPGKATVVFAIMGAGAALATLIFSSKPSTWLTSTAMLCFSWVMIFVPPPGANPTLTDIYRSSRSGWRMPPSGRLVAVLGLVLFAVGTYLQFH